MLEGVVLVCLAAFAAAPPAAVAERRSSVLYGIGSHRNVNGVALNTATEPHWPENWDDWPCSDYTKTPPSLRNETSTDGYRCAYFKNVRSCLSDGQFNYLLLPYCTWPGVKPLAYILLFLWLTFLFIALGSTAEDFFCPALTTISQTLHLSQNIAGVTFLAIGNGAPDIFSAYAAINSEKENSAGLALGALFGAGVFVTTVVVGSVAFARPFALTQRPFLRDVIFYLGAVFWSFVVLWYHRMAIGHAAGFIGLYVFYVLIVVAGRYVYQKHKKRKTGRGDIPSPLPKPEGDELSPASRVNSEPNRQGGLSGLLRSELHQSAGGSLGAAPSQHGLTGTSSPSNPSSPMLPSPATEDSGLLVNAVRSTSRRESRSSRSSSFHGHTDYSRMQSETTPLLAADNDDNNEVDRLAVSMRHFRSANPPGSHSRIKPSTALMAGALGMGGSVTAGLMRSSMLFDQRRRSASAEAALAQSGDFQRASIQVEEEPMCACSPTSRFFLLWSLLRSLRPIEPEAFKRESVWWKALDIVKIPIQFCLLLTTPVVALDQEDQNWNRPLNALHCLTAPLIVCLLTVGVEPTIGGIFPVYGAVGVCGFVLVVVVLLLTRNDRPPRFHQLFAFLGFVVSVVWIYAVANEIVSLLLALGILFHLSDAILGLTLLAWGNSIGDLVSNVTMAKQGFPRMAISACFGGPLLNVLLGIGIACTVKSIRMGGSFTVRFTLLQKICAAFLMGSLSLSLITMVLMRFNAGRKYGILLIAFYLIFLVIAIVTETGAFD